MKAQVYPGFGFLLEIGLVLFGAEILGPGRLDGKVNAPSAVPDPIDESPSAAGKNVTDLIESKDDIPRFPGYRNGFVMRPNSIFSG